MSEAEAYRGTTAPQHAVDTDRLAAWFGEHVPGFAGPLHVEQFRGGQSNPTYRVRGRERSYVLRRKPPGPLLPSAHAVDREYRVMAALAATDVPVPHVHALCQDDGVIGSAFYVMEHVEGRVFWDPRLPELPREERAALFASMNRTIAALHRVDPASVGLADFGRPGAFMARQIARWSKQYRASETETIPANLTLLKGCSIVGVFYGRFSEIEPERYRALLDELMDWLAAGRIRPVITSRRPLEEAAAALTEIAERRARGKIVLLTERGRANASPVA